MLLCALRALLTVDCMHRARFDAVSVADTMSQEAQQLVFEDSNLKCFIDC